MAQINCCRGVKLAYLRYRVHRLHVGSETNPDQLRAVPAQLPLLDDGEAGLTETLQFIGCRQKDQNFPVPVDVSAVVRNQVCRFLAVVSAVIVFTGVVIVVVVFFIFPVIFRIFVRIIVRPRIVLIRIVIFVEVFRVGGIGFIFERIAAARAGAVRSFLIAFINAFVVLAIVTRRLVRIGFRRTVCGAQITIRSAGRVRAALPGIVVSDGALARLARVAFDVPRNLVGVPGAVALFPHFTLGTVCPVGAFAPVCALGPVAMRRRAAGECQA